MKILIAALHDCWYYCPDTLPTPYLEYEFPIWKLIDSTANDF